MPGWGREGVHRRLAKMVLLAFLLTVSSVLPSPTCSEVAESCSAPLPLPLPPLMLSSFVWQSPDTPGCTEGKCDL